MICHCCCNFDDDDRITSSSSFLLLYCINIKSKIIYIFQNEKKTKYNINSIEKKRIEDNKEKEREMKLYNIIRL